MKTAFLIVDLGFGDAGKGSVVDYLAQTREISAIVRYTGGPHAAHHVVRPDGGSHAFCQFGATFRPEVRSHLAHQVIVKPENLIYEGRALEEKGISNPFARLSIDPDCRLVTSYHAMLCQMKESARGDGRFGTVGIGAGEAVLESEETPGLALRAGDLTQPDALQWKLCRHFENKQRQAQALLHDYAQHACISELRAIYDQFMSQVRLKDVYARYRYFAEQLPVELCSDNAFMNRWMKQPSDLIFEGAHATLLDRDFGYYPYVAKTTTTTREARLILEQSGFQGRICTLGVVRALGYRHGPGPFVTEDSGLSQHFEERHNRANEWQGRVRYGWFDLLAVRHSLSLNQQVDALALTMLDHLSQLGPFRVCLSYEYRGPDEHLLERYFETTSAQSGRVKITGIKPVSNQRSDTFARLLFDCVPCDWLQFDSTASAANRFVDFLESAEGLGLPVQILSSGPTAQEKRERIPAALRG